MPGSDLGMSLEDLQRRFGLSDPPAALEPKIRSLLGGLPDSTVRNVLGMSPTEPAPPQEAATPSSGATTSSETLPASAPQGNQVQPAGAPSEAPVTPGQAPTLSQQFPHPQDGQAQPPGPVTAPAGSPPPEQPSPRNPFEVATWKRNQDARSGQELAQNVRDQAALDTQRAQANADLQAHQLLAEQEAQRHAQERIDRYSKMKDDAADRLRKMTVALTSAATDVSDLYPHRGNASTAVGNALLAMSAGLGDRTAAAMLSQAAESDREWDEMSLKRHDALVNGISKATGATQDELQSYGQAGLQEGQLSQVLTMARKEMFARELDAKAAQFGPSQVGLSAQKAAALLRQENAKTQLEDADSQVKSRMMQLQLMRAENPVHGIPGAPPERPVFNDEKHKGESEENYNTRFAYWQNVEVPVWQAKMKAAGTGGGRAVPPADWETGARVAPTSALQPSAQRTFPQQGSAGQVAPGNIDLSKRPAVKNPDGSVSTVRSISIGTPKGEVLIPTVVGGKVVSDQEAIAHYRKTGENLGTFRDAATATAYAKSLHESEATRVGANAGPSQSQQTPAEQEKDRLYGIPFLGGTLTMARGKTPTMEAEKLGDLRTEVGHVSSGLEAVQALAALELNKDTTIADAVGRNPTVGKTLKGMGINVESKDKAAADAARNLLITSIANSMHERNKIALEKFGAALGPEPVLSLGPDSAPDVVKAQLGPVVNFLANPTTERLRSNNYDVTPIERYRSDTTAVIDGIGSTPKGNEQEAREQGEAKARRAEDEEWATNPYSRVLHDAGADQTEVPVEKSGDRPSARNDAPNPLKVPYQSIGNSQIDVSKRAAEYREAMGSGDYSAAHTAYNGLIDAKAAQRREARQMLTGMVRTWEDPRALVLTQRYGWTNYRVGAHGWADMLPDSAVDRFVEEMLRTNGASLRGL